MIDSLHSYPPGREFSTDLCVIGAGPAGLALAREFLGGDVRVLLVESGGEVPEPDAQALNRGLVTGARYDGLEAGRVRAFGGTSWIWTGQCLPLGPEAFASRPGDSPNPWPMDRGDLTSYYPRAAEFFQLDPRSWSEDMRSSFGIPAPRFDDSVLGTSHPALTGEMRLDRRYITEFRRATRVSTLLNATVVGLRLSPSGDAVTDAEVATLDGRRARVRAKAFVLAGGAIENARLLMMCPGLTDRLPALGRYFQDHPSEICARVEPTDRLELQDLFAVCHRRGRRYALRLRLADEAQRRAEVLACEGTLVWPVSPGLAALRRLAAGSRRPGAALSELLRAVRDGKEVLSAARRYRRGLNSAPAGVPLSLVLFCEQAPDPNSRLTLVGEQDELGLPRVGLDWRVGELERRTMIAMTDAVAAEFRRLGLGVVHPEEWLHEPEAWRSAIHDTHHPSGSTRIGGDATDSVVDSQCRVHGLDNAFVAGSSVFPAVGTASPTLTIAALAIRLADRLKAAEFT